MNTKPKWKDVTFPFGSGSKKRVQPEKPTDMGKFGVSLLFMVILGLIIVGILFN